jgi:molybdenum cofactor cytidylyltransferase
MGGLSAIVLAAGASERFGAGNKLLAEIGGEALIRRVVRGCLDGAIAEAVVVTGCDEAQIAAALQGLPVRCLIHNAAWRSGMGTSIASGIAAFGPDIEGAFVVPGDMPHLTASLLLRLAASFEAGKRRAVVFPADASGEQRNPVLWPRRLFPDLMRLSGRGGAKDLLRAHRAESIAVAVDDPALLDDVDTQEDLEAARALLDKTRP